MNINEIVGRLKAGGLDASSTNRSAAVYVTEARSGRAEPGWFGFRIICNSEATERRVRSILSRWYDIEANGNVWRLRAKNRVPLMAIKRGGVPPTPPTPAGDYLYFEAAQANSTVSMMSMLATAPDLEYSTDGETWQEWQHTTADGVHTFDTLTLTAVGDRVYLRGDNPNGLATGTDTPTAYSSFVMSGKLNGGGKLVSILDKTMQMSVLPDFAFTELLVDPMGEGTDTLLTAPSLEGITDIGKFACGQMFALQTKLTTASNMDDVETVGPGGFFGMYAGCSSLIVPSDMPSLVSIDVQGMSAAYNSCTYLTAAADMPSLTTIGDDGCVNMYSECTFAMSDDGTTLNFAFPTPPVTAGETTYATAYDVAEWMGNTNGFTEP